MTGRHSPNVSDPKIWYWDYCLHCRRLLARFWKREMRRRDRHYQVEIAHAELDTFDDEEKFKDET